MAAETYNLALVANSSTFSEAIWCTNVMVGDIHTLSADWCIYTSTTSKVLPRHWYCSDSWRASQSIHRQSSLSRESRPTSNNPGWTIYHVARMTVITWLRDYITQLQKNIVTEGLQDHLKIIVIYVDICNIYKPLTRAAGNIQYEAEVKLRLSNCSLLESKGSGL